jgi:hypothetical protein
MKMITGMPWIPLAFNVALLVWAFVNTRDRHSSVWYSLVQLGVSAFTIVMLLSGLNTSREVMLTALLWVNAGSFVFGAFLTGVACWARGDLLGLANVFSLQGAAALSVLLTFARP